MTTTFVLIAVSPKNEREIYKKLEELSDVKEVWGLDGIYDLIAKIDIKHPKTDDTFEMFGVIDEYVEKNIRSLDEVILTKTLVRKEYS